MKCVVLGLLVMSMVACTDDAPLSERPSFDFDSNAAEKKKPKLCTVEDDVGTCSGTGSGGHARSGVENVIVKVTGDSSAILTYDTWGTVTATTVWAPVGGSHWTAPDDLASAKAAPDAQSLQATDSGTPRELWLSGMLPCAPYWYGVYVDGGLKRSGVFDTNGNFSPVRAGGPVLEVTLSPHARSVDVALNVAPGALSGKLHVEVVPSYPAATIVQWGDDRSTGPATRKVRGLTPRTHYQVNVAGCGVSWSAPVDTKPLGEERIEWLSGELAPDVGATGTGSLWINDAGDWGFNGWADEGEHFGFDYSFNATLTTPVGGEIISFAHEGTIHGKWAIGSSHDDWSQGGNLAAFAAAWDGLEQKQVHWDMRTTSNFWDSVLEGIDLAAFSVGVPVMIVILGGAHGSGSACPDGWHRTYPTDAPPDSITCEGG